MGSFGIQPIIRSQEECVDMIINHEKKIIFIKTKKTAGTSLEIALSKYCGANCVIAPIAPVDEKKREALGYRTAQNFSDTYWPSENARSVGRFTAHTRATVIKQIIPKMIWEVYKKITVVRNPFDVAISRYFWEGGPDMGMNFLNYLKSFPGHLQENLRIATDRERIDLDCYIRYENFRHDLISNDLGYLWETFNGINAKADRRPSKGASVLEMYRQFPEAKEIVAKYCDRELNFFGYEFPSGTKKYYV